MNLLQALACHMIGDFAFQPDWMGKYKATHWEILGYHSATYAAPFVLAGCTWKEALVLMVSHFCIDPMKCRWKWIDKIWVDQFLHLIVLLGVFSWNR